MEIRRLTLFAGHYGSGKTNIAINYALYLKRAGYPVSIADLDIVNPYYRTLDSKKELDEAGIRLIVSRFANTNLDAPALPQDMYAVVDDRRLTCVLDVGGDDRGALALGRLSRKIREEDDYEMYMVINKYRPLTPDAASILEIRQEIELAGGLPFTGIINNSNLGAETTAETVLESGAFAEECAELLGLPLVATSVERCLLEELSGKIPNLFPMDLQKRPI